MMLVNFYKKLIAFLAVCITISASAQGDFDIRISPTSAAAGQYCVSLQISNQSQNDLEVGGGTFIFSYNTSALSFSSYSSTEYDENTMCGGTFPYNAHNEVTSTPGIVSTVLSPSGSVFISCVMVDCNWVDVFEVCFDILDPTLSSDISFGSNTGNNSLFESQDYSANYVVGDVFGLDEALDGSATGGNCASMYLDISYNYNSTGVTATYCVVDGTDNCTANTYTFTDNAATGTLNSLNAECSSLDLQVGDTFDITVAASNGCMATATGTVPAEPDCEGTPGGPVVEGADCDDGDPLTGGDTIDANCNCVGQLLDCLGVPGGSSGPGTACDDGMITTGNDVFNALCECIGEPLDCEGVPGGPDVPGASCDDGDPLTGNDVYNDGCFCIGETIDCAGEPGGNALPGTACDDGDDGTDNDTYDDSCNCVGDIIDCEGVAGGDALPGTACDDGDDTTLNDAYDNECNCVGQIEDCEGVLGGPDIVGAACDDGDDGTTNDVYGDDCVCAGMVIDCEGTVGGEVLPGTTCDDGDANTMNDVYQDDCTCAGEPLFDCLEEMVNIGDACDDGFPQTINDVYNDSCNCIGTPVDCEGTVGGTVGPGSDCDDGDAATENDVYGDDCVCAGTAVMVDCEGTPGGSANPGSACDDGDSNTDNDVYNDECVCAGEAPIVCSYSVDDIDVICDDDNGSYNVLVTLVSDEDSETYTFFDGSVELGTATLENGVATFSAGPFSNADGYLINIFSMSDGCQETAAALVVECVNTPLSLIYFNGEAKGNDNVLKWSTANELDMDRFEILRSFNGSTFEKIGQVVSAGNSNAMQHYSFVDESAPNKTSYYQLRMFGLDGSLETSNVVNIERESSVAINVYPVPALDFLNIELAAESNKEVSLEVFDITGRLLVQKKVTLDTGANLVSIEVSELVSGTYLLRIIDDSSQYGVRFIK